MIVNGPPPSYSPYAPRYNQKGPAEYVDKDKLNETQNFFNVFIL